MIRQMKVIINNTVYEMKNHEYKKFLAVAKSKVSHGIYAVEKDSVCEMKNEQYEDESTLKKAIKDYNNNGFKVYWKG